MLQVENMHLPLTPYCNREHLFKQQYLLGIIRVLVPERTQESAHSTCLNFKLEETQQKERVNWLVQGHLAQSITQVFIQYLNFQFFIFVLHYPYPNIITASNFNTR